MSTIPEEISAQLATALDQALPPDAKQRVAALYAARGVAAQADTFDQVTLAHFILTGQAAAIPEPIVTAAATRPPEESPGEPAEEPDSVALVGAPAPSWGRGWRGRREGET